MFVGPRSREVYGGGADKHKSLSLYEATDIYYMLIQKAHAYINVQNIPEGTKSFYPVVSPDRITNISLRALCASVVKN